MINFRSSQWLLAILLGLSTASLHLAKADDNASAPKVIFDADFSKGDFDRFNWKEKGAGWTIADYGTSKPGLQNNPGPLAKFGKTANGVKDAELLVRKFEPLVKPDNLALTFDAGWGWGAANQTSDDLNVMLLDDDGNGYVFHFHRANEKWGAQWGVVSKYVRPTNLAWCDFVVDGRQTSVLDGGGLKSFSIKRDSHGQWQFGRTDWPNPFTFVEASETTSTFSQVVLVGLPNFDDLCFNKIHLEATPSYDPNAIPKL